MRSRRQTLILAALADLICWGTLILLLTQVS